MEAPKVRLPREAPLTQNTSEQRFVGALVDAQRAGAKSVDQGAYPGIDRAAAYRVQMATMTAVGATPGMFKVAVSPDATGSIAPIYASRVGNSGLRLSAAGVTGLEVEVGLQLAKDLPAGADPATAEAAIGRYFMGIEICGTRYLDRKAAAFDVGLSDNMSAFGYALDAVDWERGQEANGLPIELTFNGETIWNAPAKHGFGTVLASFFAYAALPQQPYALKAGTLITTGSLCGLVPTNGPGKGVARMGGHTVEVELV
jgi:2-keto-4-pentenoate hydratase